MNAETLRQLVDYHYWATKRLLTPIMGLSADQFHRDMGSSFPSIAATVAHLLSAEGIWLHRFGSLAEKPVTNAPVQTPTEAADRWVPLETAARAFVASLDDDTLHERFHMRNSDGVEFTHSRRDALMHLFNHGTYHRGQLTTMLRQLGVGVPGTDMILFFRERK